MSAAFDIERAKAGESVEVFFLATSAWELVHFIGLDRHAQPVFQRERDGTMFPVIDRSILRMAPKKVKVRYRVAIFTAEGRHWPVIAKDEFHAESVTCNAYFVSWVHYDWQEAEIEQ